MVAMDDSSGRTSPMRRFRAYGLPVALVTAGLMSLGISWASDPAPTAEAPQPPSRQVSVADSPTPRPTTSPMPSSAARQEREPGTADRIRGPHLPASAPVALAIPRIGVSGPLGRLGLAADGTMQTPRSPEDIGWFTGSVAPGAVGPAVVAGHVTWNGRAAVFHDLATLRRHTRVWVKRQDGQVAEFAVTGVRTFPKAEFPTRSVYGPTDHAALRLITCGGRFDVDDRRYTDNVVVFARLVGVRAARRP